MGQADIESPKFMQNLINNLSYPSLIWESLKELIMKPTVVSSCPYLFFVSDSWVAWQWLVPEVWTAIFLEFQTDVGL